MSTQLDIFSVAPTRKLGPSTSREAAAKVDVRGQFAAVLNLLAAHPEGMTDDDLAAELGLLRTSAGTRRGVGVKQGYVERVGTGLSAFGNSAAIWRITDAGREYVEGLS